MARKRNPKRDDAYRLWIESNKERLLKDIADELGVAPSTVRKWKSEDKWDGETKRSVPIDKERYESMRGNQNAKGNSGGGAPADNKNAVSHGLFANWLPADVLQIVTELNQMSPADMIWQNILIQYTAIIRAQKIMYVRDEFDDTSNITGIKLNPMFAEQDGSPVKVEENREWHMAYQKQERMMNAQTRAMTTLANLIRQFVNMADDDDKRKKEIALMQLNIQKAEIEINDLTGDTEGDAHNQGKMYADALSEIAADVFNDEEPKEVDADAKA